MPEPIEKQTTEPLAISFIIPCCNEDPAVLDSTIARLRATLDSIPALDYELIIVDDGSTCYSYPNYAGNDISTLTHHRQRGYGSSILTGITHARHSWIGIIDADGTYPVEQFKEMIPYTDSFDMVVGQRNWKDIEAIKRVPKYILQKLACFLAKDDIPDLNSGMRLFKKKIALEHRRIFPEGFSLTSTMTMVCATNGYATKYIPITYSKRVGPSHISPFQDTAGFFTLVLRLSLYFQPLRFFVPLSMLIGLMAVARAIRDMIVNNFFGGLTLVLFFMAFQIFFFGLIAEIINKK